MSDNINPDKKFLILTAPSGAGKTTLAHALMRRLPWLDFSISATTRPPRKGEREGVDYYFMSERSFREKIAEGAFIEYEEPYKNKLYGTLYSELERIWNSGKIPLRIVEVKGAASLKAKFKERVLSIFIKPPSLDALQQRLLKRGDESPEDLSERLERARKEMTYENNFDFVVLNDQLKGAIESAEEIIRSFFHQEEKNNENVQ